MDISEETVSGNVASGGGTTIFDKPVLKVSDKFFKKIQSKNKLKEKDDELETLKESMLHTPFFIRSNDKLLFINGS